MVESLVANQEVVGSNPTVRANSIKTVKPEHGSVGVVGPICEGIHPNENMDI